LFSLSISPAFSDAQKLSVSDAIALARAHSPSLKSMAAQTSGALADARSAQAKKAVQISANTFVLSSSMGGIVQSAPDSSPSVLLNAQSRGFADQNITAMVPISTGGRLEAQIDSARFQSGAAKNRYDASSIDLSASVASAYVDSALSFELVNAAQSRVDSENEQLKAIREKVQNGKAAQVDELSEESELADAQKELAEAQGDSLRDLAVLKSLVFLDQSAEYDLTDSLDLLANRWMLPQGTLSELIAKAYTLRPEIAEAKANSDAASAGVRFAKGSYSPQISGFAMADASDRTGSPMGGGNGGYLVGVSASLSIADGGQRKADLDSAASKVSQAGADLEIAKNKIASNVAVSLAGIGPAQRAVESAEASVVYAQKAFELADLRYSSGKAILAERLASSAALARAKANLLQAKASQIKANIELIRATGNAIR
jgi:outer membrane protein TolC